MSTAGSEMCPRMNVRGPGERLTRVGVNAMPSSAPMDGLRARSQIVSVTFPDRYGESTFLMFWIAFADRGESALNRK
ncbi:MAG: hypothetical protein V7647_2264 [Acidobacteriota bacterium]